MTRIEWTDCVWNPVTGCSKVSSGCSRCYAERIFPLPYPGRNFTDVRCHPERLREPLRWRRPRRVFVKQLGGLPVEDGQRILLQDPKGGDPSEWPGGLGIRQYPEPRHG